jgi:VanZ family protein
VTGDELRSASLLAHRVPSTAGSVGPRDADPGVDGGSGVTTHHDERPVLTDFLLRHPWLSPTALGLLVLLGPGAGARLVSRTKLTWWLCAASLVPVAATTLSPSDRRPYAFCAVQRALPTVSRVELMANVVLFVAPVLLLAVATRRPVLALLVGIALSAVIELVQALLPWLGRSCDTTDWSSNSIGAAIGAALGSAALRLSDRSLPGGAEPPADRRG